VDDVALIVGAGWSAAAGYPLAKDLLTGPILTASKQADKRSKSVRNAFVAWSDRVPNGLSEQFLADVARGRVVLPEEGQKRLFEVGPTPLPWSWVVEYVQLRLATAALPQSLQGLRPSRPIYYERRYNDSIWGQPSPPHGSFTTALLTTARLVGVITLNYDLTCERALHPCPCRRAPGFFYDGLVEPRVARTETHASELFAPGMVWRGEGTVPLVKLHGSLNWHVQNDQLLVFQDARLAFRAGGTAAIVAPVPEKAPPPWLAGAWRAARAVLSSATRWVVVGYSLPAYDRAVFDLLHSTAADVQRVELHDPAATALRDRWQAVALDADVIPFPGLDLSSMT
jgi:hypothetical protein